MGLSILLGTLVTYFAYLLVLVSLGGYTGRSHKVTENGHYLSQDKFDFVLPRSANRCDLSEAY